MRWLSDDEHQALDDRLRPMLTDEFLRVLVEAARTVENSADSVATAEFVDAVFGIANRPRVDLTPYDTDTDAARLALETMEGKG